MRFFLYLSLLSFAALPLSGAAAKTRASQVTTQGQASITESIHSTRLATSTTLAEAVEAKEFGSQKDGECVCFAQWIAQAGFLPASSSNGDRTPPSSMGRAPLSPRAPPSLL